MYSIVPSTNHTEEEQLNLNPADLNSGIVENRSSFATALDSEHKNDKEDLPKIIESSPPPVPPHRRGEHVVEFELEKSVPPPLSCWEKFTSRCNTREKKRYSFVQGEDGFGGPNASIVSARQRPSSDLSRQKKRVTGEAKAVMTVGLMSVALLVCFVWIFTDSYPIKGDRPKKLVDMSYPYDNETLFWPNQPRFDLEVVFKGNISSTTWYQANKFCAAEHGGTHMDAPTHFQEDKWSVDQIPVDRLIAPAVVLNISERVEIDPDVNVTVDDVTAWEKAHGPIPDGAVVFMYSGWGKFWPNATSYFGNGRNDINDLHFPSFGNDAVLWIINNRNVVGFGVDGPSLDYGPSTEYPNHKTLAAHNLFGLENVANLGELPPAGARVTIMPLKIEGGTGAPTRIVGEFQ